MISYVFKSKLNKKAKHKAVKQIMAGHCPNHTQAIEGVEFLPPLLARVLLKWHGTRELHRCSSGPKCIAETGRHIRGVCNLRGSAAPAPAASPNACQKRLPEVLHTNRRVSNLRGSVTLALLPILVPCKLELTHL